MGKHKWRVLAVLVGWYFTSTVALVKPTPPLLPATQQFGPFDTQENCEKSRMELLESEHAVIDKLNALQVLEHFGGFPVTTTCVQPK